MYLGKGEVQAGSRGFNPQGCVQCCRRSQQNRAANTLTTEPVVLHPIRRPEQGFMRGLVIVGLDNVVASTFITVDVNTITNINVIIPAHDSHSLHETMLVKN